MKSNITIPKKIKIGFNKRVDTYNGNLGYIIMFDGKVWRKEKSWENWRDHTITPIEYDNKPIEGFVINIQKGGIGSGYHRWDTRTEKIRIYDPRGFEFEITIPNLLYILQNTNSIKGKGISGLLMYGWDGKDLVLIPENAPEYQEMIVFNELQTKKVNRKELIQGGIYINNKNEKITFLEDNYFYNGEGDKKKVLYCVGREYDWKDTLTIVKIDPKNIKSYTNENNVEFADWYTKLQDYIGYKDYVAKLNGDYEFTPIKDLHYNTLNKTLYLETTLKNGAKKYTRCKINPSYRVLKPNAIPTIVKTIHNGSEYVRDTFDYMKDYNECIVLHVGKIETIYNSQKELFHSCVIGTQTWIDKRTWSYRLLTDKEKESTYHYFSNYYILKDGNYVSIDAKSNYKEEMIDNIKTLTCVYSLRGNGYYDSNGYYGSNPYNDNLEFLSEKELVNYYQIYKKVQD